MAVVHCLICNRSLVELGKESVMVKFSTHHKTCEHCNNTREDKHSDFLCFRKYCERMASNV